jgi:REP element-mobilizing transposase RayT
MMKFDPTIHHRRSIRVPGYDYSQPGAYFVTMVTRGRECLLGKVREQEMRPNAAGNIVWEVWNCLPVRYPEIVLGTAAVMPNHFHGIIEIPVGAVHEPPLPETQSRMARRRMTIPLVAGFFKMQSSKQINILHRTPGERIWQRNYYEHIIHDEDDHSRIFDYIEANVENWSMDEENPSRSCPVNRSLRL